MSACQPPMARIIDIHFLPRKIDGQPTGGNFLFQEDETRKKEIEQTRLGMRVKKKQDEKEKKGKS